MNLRAIFAMLESVIDDESIHSEKIPALIDDPNAEDAEGFTLLHLAVQANHLELVKYLLGYRQIKLHHKTKGAQGRIPLHLAAKEGHAQIIAQLLNFEHSQSQLDFALQLAVLYKHYEAVKILLSRGVNPKRSKILHTAIKKNQVEIVKILLINGANPNETFNEIGDSVLHSVADDGKLELTKLLLEHGADPNYQNKQGKTALNYAASSEHNEIVDILLKSHAGKATMDTLKDTKRANSFAAKFHQALFKKTGRDIPVVARTQNVECAAYKSANKWYIRKQTKNLNHHFYSESEVYIDRQPGSKVVYMMRNGKQICCDAYSYEWKDEALQILEDLSRKTKVCDKKMKLQEWVVNFQKKNPQEIYQILKQELKNPKTVLKDHFSAPYSPARLFNAASFNSIEKLVAEGKPYIESEYVTIPMLTGRGG